MLAEVAQPLLAAGAAGSSATTGAVLLVLGAAAMAARCEVAQRHERWLDTALRVGLGEPAGTLGAHLEEYSEGLWIAEGLGTALGGLLWLIAAGMMFPARAVAFGSIARWLVYAVVAWVPVRCWLEGKRRFAERARALRALAAIRAATDSS